MIKSYESGKILIRKHVKNTYAGSWSEKKSNDLLLNYQNPGRILILNAKEAIARILILIWEKNQLFASELPESWQNPDPEMRKKQWPGSWSWYEKKSNDPNLNFQDPGKIRKSWSWFKKKCNEFRILIWEKKQWQDPDLRKNAMISGFWKSSFWDIPVWIHKCVE